MIPAAWLRWTPLRVAIGALVASTVIAGYTLVRALQLSEIPVASMPVLPNPTDLTASAPRIGVDIPAAIDRDVFDPSRVAPTNRYLLASEIEDIETPAAPLPRVVVLGIALADGGRSFATCQVGADRPTIVRVGDKLGPYKIKAIESKRVVLTLPSGAVETVAALTSGFGN